MIMNGRHFLGTSHHGVPSFFHSSLCHLQANKSSSLNSANAELPIPNSQQRLGYASKLLENLGVNGPRSSVTSSIEPSSLMVQKVWLASISGT